MSISTVFTGSDGSFLSPWQVYKLRNKEYEKFVLGAEDKVVFRRTDEEGNETSVLYVKMDEADLPDGVELSENGYSVRDRRPE